MSNQQPVVDINTDVIIAKAKEAYEKYEQQKDNPIGRGLRAQKLAEHVPELLRLLIEVDEQNQYLKELNDYSLKIREELSRQLALDVEAMRDKAELY